VIKNGTVVDGTGNRRFESDICIKNGRILEVSKDLPTTGVSVMDASNLVVSPGFIDTHSHDDWGVLLDPCNFHSMQQGVTTVLCGQCGSSPYPLTPKAKEYVSIQLSEEIPSTEWSSLDEYMKLLEEIGIGINFAFLVGHGSIRTAVMGMDEKKATTDEMDEMCKLAGECMDSGAFGLSTGLIYPPGVFSDLEEVCRVTEVIARYSGTYVTHMRDEGDRVIESIKETREIGRQCSVPVHISHHKVSGVKNWGKSVGTLKLIEEINESGQRMTADAYPYTAGSTNLAALLPPWVHDGGEAKMKERLASPDCRERIRTYILERSDWQNFIQQIPGWDCVLLTSSKSHKEFQGKNISDIARMTGKDPMEVVFDLCLNDGYHASMVIFMMDNEDVERIICHPVVMVGSDSSAASKDAYTHPRAYGAFTKILGEFLREKHLLNLEEAVRKMTLLPAKTFGLTNKGCICKGYDADLVIFDPEKVGDRATYEDPTGLSVGVEKVIIGGELVYSQGEVVEKKAGRIVRRGV